MSSNTVQLVPRGRTFIRGLIAHTLVKGDAVPYAANRWGEAQAQKIAKAAVPALLAEPGGTPEAREFFGLATEQSLLGRISGLRRIAFNTRNFRQTVGATGYWVAESKPIPLSSVALEDFTLAPLRVATIVVQTKEAIESYGEVTEAALQRDVQNAISGSLDLAFIDPSNAGVPGEVPAAITSGQTQIASTGNAKQDIEAMFNAYSGSYRTATIVMHPRTAVQLGLLDAQVGDTKLTVTGGVLAGVPVVCTEAVPLSSNGGSITLLDAAAIAYGARDFEMDVSEHASLQMRDDPVDAPTETVDLWQTNSVAWKAQATANWEISGTGKVVTITDVDYAQGV